MKTELLSVGMAAAVVCMLATPARAALIVNGDFETNTLAGWTAGGNVTTAPLGYFGFNDPAYGSYFAVFNGGNLAPNGSLSQSFATVAGQQYTLTFDYGVDHGATQSIVASVTDSSSVVLATLTATTNSVAANPFSLTFTADTALSTVTFADQAYNPTYNTDGGLDNVSVNAVPEPGSMALLAGALLTFARLRRRS